jgi:hypothetical protein
MAPEPGASKLFCAVGRVILAEDTGSVSDGSIAKVDISERAKNLQTKLRRFLGLRPEHQKRPGAKHRAFSSPQKGAFEDQNL